MEHPCIIFLEILFVFDPVILFMSHERVDDVTDLLIAWSDGNQEAMDRLMPLVYAELRGLAGHYLARVGHQPTLSATVLVHEAWMRLVDQRRVQWQNRAHFFALSARIIRGLLVDHARARDRQKRGGGAVSISFDETRHQPIDAPPELLALDQVLEQLCAVDEQLGQIVELRFFGGLTNEEIAQVLDLSTATVTRRWRAARAWLHTEIAEGGHP